MMFWFWKLLGRLGFFNYEGITGMQPGWWPAARVRYFDDDEENHSASMAIGNAWDYADVFDGEVVPVDVAWT